ncbi:4'-phosphopantetheinyl transferase family protein [Rufibacter quisquiliarum]|uniref:4'-phosphopantetheinyl transferase EntD n=1 Tax=Rufibacter quisquiliarum TaxID=1549639 RepID=A0A839GNH6_9BACT|nr:4'-phosphopantetheinyl transferase family protein [Rufibacter quisquiliarum]MBA9075401.1 4'-phosphopantetheinyl transferase EntD [Rufibacter quisquiliarum]
MPLLPIKQLNASTYLGLWKVEEPVEELQKALLKLRPGHEIPAFKAESRTKEWLAARVLTYTLLTELTQELVTLERLETGQPFCAGGAFQVSLTHSGPWVAALVSGTHQVGIDIELKGEKVPRLVPRFLNEPELAASAGNPEKMHLYWSAKETLYKVYSQKKLLFKEHLLLKDFEVQQAGSFAGTVQTDNFSQTFAVQYENPPEYVLTFVVAPKN